MKHIFTTSIVLVFLALMAPRFGHAATLKPVAPNQTVSVGSTVTVELRLDSEGEVINAVEAVLRYDPEMLRALEVSRGGSFLTLWAEDPRVVRPGEITLTGGVPDGSLVVGGMVVRVTMKALSVGTSAITVDAERSGVYKHDGFGTPAVLTTTPLVLDVQQPDISAPILASTSHPVEGTWYKNPTLVVAWTVYPQAVVSYRLSRDPFTEPDDVIEENSGFASFPNLTDGIWYFSFRQRLPGEDWGRIIRREVRIDSTPPEPFAVDVSRDSTIGKYLASFAAIDRTSGIASYRVRTIRASFWKPWSTIVDERRVDGAVSFDDVRDVKSVTVTAIDGAGNSRRAIWYSTAYRDGTRWLFFMTLSVILVLSLILFSLVRRPRPQQRWRGSV